MSLIALIYLVISAGEYLCPCGYGCALPRKQLLIFLCRNYIEEEKRKNEPGDDEERWNYWLKEEGVAVGQSVLNIYLRYFHSTQSLVLLE